MNQAPDSFEYWMEKVRSYWRNIAKPLADTNQSHDDEEKLRWFIDIDRRHLMAKPDKLPDKVSEKVLQEFIAILHEYKKLLLVEPPNYPLYKVEDLRDKIANVMEDIADIYDAMCNIDAQAGFYYKQASFYYHQAIQSYVENGNAEAAKICRQKIIQLRLNYEVKVNRAIENFFITLESLSQASFQYLENLIDLGELYFANGDDFEAEKCLLLSENKLKELGYAQFSITEIAESLPTHSNTQSAYLTDDLNNIEMASQVREFYRRIYFALSQIYRKKAVKEAAKYLEIVDSIDGSGKNKNFSDQMLNWLNSDFYL
jgi:hypothetical protein